MFSFKPREIRVILILSTLALIGSSITLLKRQGKLGALDLDIFLNNDNYKYSYNIKEISAEEQTGETEGIAEQIDPDTSEPVEPETIDLNQADYFSLQRLPGIGPVLAERIITYRDSAGRFDSIEDLLHVSGIGERKFADIKDKVTVD